MFASAFEYHKATSVADAIQLLNTNREARLLAGGHSLIPLLKLRQAGPPALIDIGGIDELRGISTHNGAIRIGALTTHRAIETSDEVGEACAMMAEVDGGIGDPQVRNRGTIGGNVVRADPASDWPTVLTVIEVPRLRPNQLAEYAKMAHPATSFAVVGAAVVVTVDGGRCTSASVIVGDLVPVPVRVRAVEAALVGQELTPDIIAAASERVSNDLGPNVRGDRVFASADYRRAVAGVEVKHALLHAAGLAHH